MAGDLISTINAIRSGAGQPTVNPILAAAMSGASQLSIDAANKRAAEDQSKADQETSYLIKGDKVSVKNMNAQDFIRAAADSGSMKTHQVAQLLRPASEAAKTHEMVRSYGFNTEDPNDPRVLAGDQGSFGGGYKSARELGYGLFRSAIHGMKAKAGFVPDASSPDSDASQVQARRAAGDLNIANKAVLPQEQFRLQQQKENSAEGRAQQAHNVGLETEFERLTKPENAVLYPTADALSSAGKREFGENWTPERDSAARNAWQQATTKLESSKVASRRSTIRQSITPEAVGFAPDAESYLTNIEDPGNPFSAGDRAYAKNLFEGAKKTWDEARGQKKMALAIEGARLQLEQNKLTQEKLLTSAAQFLQNPKTKDSFIDNIAADGNAYYDPNVQKNPYVKSALDGELLARFGRVPNKIEKGDHDTLVAAQTGNNNLDQMDAILKKWDDRKIPITGAMVGRFNDLTAKGGATGALAMRGVPAKFRAEMATDINNLRNHMLNLSVQEARTATGGGRTAAQVIELYKEASPALFQDGPLLAGSAQGVRAQLVGRANSVYQQQWGPSAPVKMFPNGKLGIWDGKGWVQMGSR